MGHLEGNFTPVLSIGRKVPKRLNKQGAGLSEVLVIPEKDRRRWIFGFPRTALDVLVPPGCFAVLVCSCLPTSRSDLQVLNS